MKQRIGGFLGRLLSLVSETGRGYRTGGRARDLAVAWGPLGARGGAGQRGVVKTLIACSLGLSAFFVVSGARAEQAPDGGEPSSEPWYEAFDFRLFADAYTSVNTHFPKPQTSNALRAYDQTSGFSLAWVGLDVRYAPQPVGGTLSLRAGPTADTIGASCLSSTTRCDGDVAGLGLVTQAFGSWAPTRRVVLDFGKFYDQHGSELPESQDNLNYSRSLLHTLAQPVFHTGLRASWQIGSELKATALVVNGWNNTVDNNLGKTFGLALAYQPVPQLSVKLGWLGGPEQDDAVVMACPQNTEYSPGVGSCVTAPGVAAHEVNVDRGGANSFRAWRHLADLVVRYRPVEVLDLVLDGVYGEQGTRSLDAMGDTRTVRQRYYGVLLGARYAFDPTWAAAARIEYFADPEGLAARVSQLKVGSGTLTLEAKPTDQLVLRLEERADVAFDAEGSTRIFPKGARKSSSHQYTTTLGVVVMTN